MWMYTSSPALLMGSLCLSPPGHVGGWRGLFIFNLAVKLLSGAWERDETFQLGSSLGARKLAQVPHRELIGFVHSHPSTITLHTHTCSEHNHAIQSRGPWANSHTEKHEHLCSHFTHSHNAQRAPCHSKTVGLSGHQACCFHFIPATPPTDSAPTLVTSP